MEIKIDVIYQDGEVIACRKQNCSIPGKKPVLLRGTTTRLDLRFCNPAGEPEMVISEDSFGHAQALLSCCDRLLVSREDDITLFADEDGFQVLRIDNFDIDNQAVRNLLADSYLDLDRKNHGYAECEFSAALYSNGVERLMQLFFTFDVRVKNLLLP